MNDRLSVVVLDVGQGDCTIILLPDERAIVFDCADDYVLGKVLDDWKVQIIEAFILSHLDQDHIAGALAFLADRERDVRHVHLSLDRRSEAKGAKALLDHVMDQSRHTADRPRRWEFYSNTRDRNIAEGTGRSVRILAPEYADEVTRVREGTWEEANRYSSVLRIDAGGNAMLVGGDAPLLSWSGLPGQELGAKVFRIPHHGGAIDDGGVPSGWDVARLYNEVGADTAIISVGTNNSHGHAVYDWIRPVTGGACRLLCTQVTPRCHPPLEFTDTNGVVRRDPREISEQRARVLHRHKQWTVPQYRHLTDKRNKIRAGQLEVPCTGSLVVMNGQSTYFQRLVGTTRGS